MKPKTVSRIAIAAFAGVLALGGGVLGASSAGLLSSTPTSLDPQSYVLPPPEPVAPAEGLPSPNPSLSPDVVRIQKGIGALDRTDAGRISFSLIDLTGKEVFGEDSRAARVPASSWKILTSLATLSAYGASHRFSTTVVSSSDGIVLVGGGDPFLTANGGGFNPNQATIRDLADQTARALKDKGRSSVILGYDASLFAGPAWSPAWPEGYSGDIAPISALSVDVNMYADPSSDTGWTSTVAFKDLLVARGITVKSVRSERAAAGAEVLGAVQSLPLGLIVQRVIKISDNYAAEVLFRHVGLAAGSDGSFTSGQAALTAYLKSHDLWTDGMSVSDGSGLSLSDKVSASVLARAVRVAYEDPGLSDVLAGMPVGGVDGGLLYRFDDPDEAEGRGVTRAKTGTHHTVRSLTGFVQTSSGAILFFSFVANEVGDHYATVDWFDKAVAVVASG